MVSKQARHCKSRSSEIFFQVSSWDGSSKLGKSCHWIGGRQLRACSISEALSGTCRQQWARALCGAKGVQGRLGSLTSWPKKWKAFKTQNKFRRDSVFLKNVVLKYPLLRCWKETVEGKLFRINQQGKSDTLKLVCALCMCVCACTLSRVWLFVTSWTVVRQAPLSMGFSRQEYRNRGPFPTPGDLPNSGIESVSPALQVDSLPPAPPGNANYFLPCRVFFISQSILKYPS